MHPVLRRLFAPAVQGFLINAFSYDPRRLISGFSKPVLIVQGQRDVQVSEQDAQLLQQADPEAKLVLLSDVNHVLKSVLTQDLQDNMLTHSRAGSPLASGVIEAISEFLTSNSSAGKN